MSLVGPRPEDSAFVAHYEEQYGEILSVRPGMTGLGQLAFANEAEVLDPGDRVGHYVGRILPQKVHLELLYARSRSVRGDLGILVWTVLPVIMRVDVAVNRNSGELTVRRRRRSGSGSTLSR
jgi:lipopolysaccharide/colanic/teichoic acid biosynthesis glycosyltransferase